MMKKSDAYRYQSARILNGFTLVEMAVVLVIIGLMIGGLIMPLGAQMHMRKVAETMNEMEQIKEALIGFAIVNGRLPRPATSASNGSENATLCADEIACTGYIPWVTLGVHKLDAWNKIIRYSVTPAYANGSISLAPTIATKTIQNRDSTGMPVYVAGSSNCAVNKDCTPAVIYSAGEKNYGTSDDGGAIPDCSGCINTDEDKNDNTATNLGANFIDRTYTNNDSASGGQFDDVVTWISSNILFSRMVAAGKLP